MRKKQNVFLYLINNLKIESFYDADDNVLGENLKALKCIPRLFQKKG